MYKLYIQALLVALCVWYIIIYVLLLFFALLTDRYIYDVAVMGQCKQRGGGMMASEQLLCF